MVARILLLLTVGALVWGGCSALVPGGSPFGIPPADPSEAAVWSADRTRQVRQEGNRQATLEAGQLEHEQSAQDTLDAKQAKLDSEKRALEEAAAARREESTRAAQARLETAEATRQLATIVVQETAAERDWIAQGWTATADSVLAAAKATGDQAAAWRQETADAAAVQALSTAQAAQALVAAQKAEQERLNTERLVIRKSFDAWAPYLIGLLIGSVVVAGLWYWRRHQVVPRDSNGLLPGIRVGDRVLDPERSILPVLDPKMPVQANLAAHLQITENAQKVQALKQLQGKGTPSQALGLLKSAPAASPAANGNGNGNGAHLPPASWSQFERETGLAIPLGTGPNGTLHLPDPEEYPHRLLAGATGGGKSRYGIRPYTAGALGRGWNVVALGDRRPVDLKIFTSHPNFYDLTQDDPAEIVRYLAAIQVEIKRREAMLWDAGASTWSRLSHPDPRVAIVFDEFAALIDALEGPTKANFIRLVSNISRLARKVGIHLVCGVQNPTADNIRPSIRRNMLPVAFKVIDQAASRVILESDGAEKLVPPQYMARWTGLWHGVGFDPTDEQIGNYLASRQVPAYDMPVFLVKLPEPDDPILLEAQAESGVQRLAEQIRPEWEKGASKRAMARAAGREYAGWFAAQIDKAIEYLSATTTSLDGQGSAPGVAGAK